ncbi:MAG TPA: hypothetical protein VFR69_09710 [Rubrobacteraceae bacterium]|nr:hypothetical protein [Rubrobacteraceae bacterium]
MPDEAGNTATVGAADCGANSPGAGATVTFPPLAYIQVRLRDGGSGEPRLTPNETIACDNPTGTDDASDTTGWDDTLTVTGIEAGATEVPGLRLGPARVLSSAAPLSLYSDRFY